MSSSVVATPSTVSSSTVRRNLRYDARFARSTTWPNGSTATPASTASTCITWSRDSGPLVVLCHGFPHLWFSWRHQIPVLAAAGWRVIAPDMRGMGQTGAPPAIEAYGVDRICDDLTGLLDHLGEESAIFAGLDFGAFAIYDLALREPARVRAVIGLENPAAPHDPDVPPLTEYAAMAKQHFVHIEYFREPGVADAALEAAPREFLRKVFYALSGAYHYLDVWKHPPGTTYLDALPETPPLPWPWLSELELEFFVSEYARSGFTGGLNYYRSMDLKWRQRKPYEGVQSPVPAFFIGSEFDCDLEGFHGPDPIELMRAQFPDLRAVADDPRRRPPGADGEARRGQPLPAALPRDTALAAREASFPQPGWEATVAGALANGPWQPGSALELHGGPARHYRAADRKDDIGVGLVRRIGEEILARGEAGNHGDAGIALQQALVQPDLEGHDARYERRQFAVGREDGVTPGLVRAFLEVDERNTPDHGLLSRGWCRSGATTQRSSVKPAATRSQLCGVTPRSRSLYFCTLLVGV